MREHLISCVNTKCVNTSFGPGVHTPTCVEHQIKCVNVKTQALSDTYQKWPRHGCQSQSRKSKVVPAHGSERFHLPYSMTEAGGAPLSRGRPLNATYFLPRADTPSRTQKIRARLISVHMKTQSRYFCSPKSLPTWGKHLPEGS